MTRINKLLTKIIIQKCKGNLCTKVWQTFEQYNAQINMCYDLLSVCLGGEGGHFKYSENLFVLKIKFCTA